MTRQERLAQIRPLLDQGLTHRQIAERLGISRTHVSRIVSDRTYATVLRLARESKRRRIGTCIDCGAETRYNGSTVAGASRHCFHCACIARSRPLRGTGPLQQRALAFLDQPRRWEDVRARLQERADQQPLTTICGLCDWTYTGTAYEGRELAKGHRRVHHPELKPTGRRRGTLQRFRPGREDAA